MHKSVSAIKQKHCRGQNSCKVNELFYKNECALECLLVQT